MDDLLDGSDDEGEPSIEKDDDVMLDVDELISTNAPANKARALISGIGLDISLSDNSSDEEEEPGNPGIGDTGRESESELKSERLLRMLSLTAPGVNLFPTTDNADNKFCYFDLDSLSLERDCEYTRRGKLLGHGFSNERLDIILTDRFEFLRHLFPEAQSVLICDKNDFRAIMNFLLFSISVCTDENISDLMTKALFDLRRNYGFRWDLSLKHIVTVLMNYGVSKNSILDEKFYNKPNVGLLKHLEQVKKSGQATETKYKLPRLPEFIQKRQRDTSSSRPVADVSPDQYDFCLARFVQVICQFISGFPSHIDFKRKNNWSDQIILMHILLLLGTDKRFILKHPVKTDIRLALHFLIESFSTELWHWGPASKPSKGEKDRGETFNHYNAHKSLARLVHEFFPGELCPEVITWSSRQEMKETNQADSSDHHLNMMHRINLIPQTYRGNQLRKYLAFMYLQCLAEVNQGISLPTHIQVAELTDSVGMLCILQSCILHKISTMRANNDLRLSGLCDKLYDGIKVVVMSENWGMTMTLVEFYDIIIGQEAEDFTEENVEHIKKLSKCVLGWFRKRLPSMAQALDINNEKSIQAMQLSEYLDIVDSRWKQGCNDC